MHKRMMSDDGDDDDDDGGHWSKRRRQLPNVTLSPQPSSKAPIGMDDAARAMFDDEHDETKQQGVVTRGRFKRFAQLDSEESEELEAIGDEVEDESLQQTYRKKAEMCDEVSLPAPRTINDKWPSKHQLKEEVRKRKWIDLSEINFVNHANQRRKGFVTPNIKELLSFCVPRPPNPAAGNEYPLGKKYAIVISPHKLKEVTNKLVEKRLKYGGIVGTYRTNKEFELYDEGISLSVVEEAFLYARYLLVMRPGDIGIALKKPVFIIDGKRYVHGKCNKFNCHSCGRSCEVSIDITAYKGAIRYSMNNAVNHELREVDSEDVLPSLE